MLQALLPQLGGPGPKLGELQVCSGLGPCIGPEAYRTHLGAPSVVLLMALEIGTVWDQDKPEGIGPNHFFGDVQVGGCPLHHPKNSKAFQQMRSPIKGWFDLLQF